MDERPLTRYCQAPDGVSLAYQVVGDGPLNLLWAPIDAYPIDLLMEEPGFRHVAKRLAAFSRAVFCDARGQGASGGNPFDRFKEDIMDADLTTLFDATELTRTALVGYGRGGPMAIRFTVTHPEQVTALVLINTHPHYMRDAEYPVGFSRESLEQYLAWVAERWGTGATVGTAPSKASDTAFRERMARNERLGRRPEQAAELTRLSFGQDVRHLLSAISVPTLVLHRVGNSFIRVEAGRYLGSHIPGAKYAELPGEDHYLGAGDVDGLVDEVEEFLTGSRQGPDGDVVSTSILFTDIVSSTEQAARMGHRKWTTVTDDHDAMVRATLQRYRGHEVKTTGDGFLVTFDSTTRAVRAATDIVTAAREMGIEVRACVHIGEVEVRSDDVVGLAVSIAKRICDLAGPGQVFVSEGVKGGLAGSGIVTLDQGTHALKGVPDEWRLFVVER